MNIAEQFARQVTIKGHPTTTLLDDAGNEMRVTVCAECGALRSVMWLDKNRWFCRSCRTAGAATPTRVPISNPARRR